jgi:hypothetical protein
MLLLKFCCEYGVAGKRALRTLPARVCSQPAESEMAG